MLGSTRAYYKIVLLGDSGVGKTSLIRRYVHDAFDEGYLATIGTRVSKHSDVVSLEGGRGVQVNLVIWDVMGNRKILELLGDAYFDGARGALAVFDASRRKSLEGLKDWIDAARREEPRMPIIVLGNKADLVERRTVTDGEATEFCRSLGLPYLPTSAKTGLNVEAAFRRLSMEALRTFALLRAEQGAD